MLRTAFLILISTSFAFAATPPAIEWLSWGPATFERARREGKLVLLDCEAAWCHWCHVMDDTSYRDPAVREILARRYLCARVDVDQRPDLAERYGDWGWPATILFSAGLEEMKKLQGYVPPDRFARILTVIAERHDKAGGRGPFPLDEPDRPPPPAAAAGKLDAAKLTALRARWERDLEERWDPKNGGWGFVQKNLCESDIEYALLRVREAAWPGKLAALPAIDWREHATRTLDCLGKIIDPVWGGLCQYSTNGDWDHQHHEKLTNYQAQALSHYARASITTREPRHLERARQIHGYLATLLRAPDGTAYTSQDADLRRPGKDPVPGDVYWRLPDAKRRALGLPRIDTAVYAYENGLVLSALVDLYAATQDLQVLREAERAAAALEASHTRVSGPGMRRVRHAASSELGTLKDTVALARGFLSVHEATGHERWFALARAIAAGMERDLRDPKTGAFFYSAAEPGATGALATRRTPFFENVAAARFLARLAIHDPDGPWERQADAVLAWLSTGDFPSQAGMWLGGYLLLVAERELEPLHVTIVGPAGDPRRTALLARAYAVPAPNLIVDCLDPKDPDARRARRDTFPANEPPAAYACTAGSCSAPLRDAAHLAERLKTIAGR